MSEHTKRECPYAHHWDSDCDALHRFTTPVLRDPPDPNAHPDWCKCQRVCGGDQ